ncbi:serpin family protein [Glycomyces paridis]|uniref:Serpin family protein n=1 Tax=Glycomyces paridis TaxID=2126555 RepID=A0A4V4HPQ9_9ACTN|nr:serpin family protein [Glycomyces paridis]THV30896.1 serpin family protein [Glycomyces paridis]
MSTDEGTFELTSGDVAAANGLTRRWFASRAAMPSAASGLGIWPLLGVLASGAVGPTLDELLAAAGLDADRAAAAPELLLRAVRAMPAVRIALGVWAGARVALDPDWVAGLPVGAVGSLTGDLVADQAALDAWADEHTDGLIDRMPITLDEEIRLVLASALLVRTTWATPFEETYAPFPTGPWAEQRHQVLTASYDRDVLRVGDDASVLTVIGRDDVDVLLAIGRENLDPGEVMARLLDAAGEPAWGRSSTELAAGDRAVGVEAAEYLAPRPQTGPEVAARTVAFTVADEIDLTGDAEALGLVHACDARFASFDRLAAEPLVVSQAKQACTATFSATGFEAAAVTAIGMPFAGALPPQDRHRHVRATVTFDRPFAYLARHRPTGLVLVAGWVAEPASAAALPSLHE